MKTTLVNTNYTHDWVLNILRDRGIDDNILAEFIAPTPSNLQEPTALENIESAADCIIHGVHDGKKFGILADCDVDGITSASLVYHYLKEMRPDLDIYYTFHEHKQHGLSDCYQRFIEADIDILIEPDAGINDKEYHDLLGEAGIVTVVADHHEYENVGFSDYAIYVDNQTSPNYRNKSLAGCGVAWQLCRMIDSKQFTNYADKYIDLVALGCCADVMSPLTLENRYIFDYGFSHLQDPSFKAIVAKQDYSMKGKINYTSVAFYVAPLINACMRTGTHEEKSLMYSMMINPMQQVESHKRGVAAGTMVPITEECIRILTNVKARQQRLIDNYISTFDARIASEGLNDNNILLLHLNDDDDFDAELNGLIATKFSAKYNKPCLVLRDGLDGLTKGSARNPHGSPIIDLKELINQSPYTSFTVGHASAHGLGINTACLDKFIDWFNDTTKDLNFAENTYQINFDIHEMCLYFESLCFDIASHVEYWGGDNPEPVIGLTNIHINPSMMNYMGANKDTIKFNLNGVDCMIFRRPDLVKEWQNMNEKIIINAIGRASINEWGGRTTAQLIIDDLEWHKDSIIDF